MVGLAVAVAAVADTRMDGALPNAGVVAAAPRRRLLMTWKERNLLAQGTTAHSGSPGPEPVGRQRLGVDAGSGDNASRREKHNRASGHQAGSCRGCAFEGADASASTCQAADTGRLGDMRREWRRRVEVPGSGWPS